MLNILISTLLPLLIQPKVLEPDRELVGGGQLGLPRDHHLQSRAGDRGHTWGRKTQIIVDQFLSFIATIFAGEVAN